MSHAEDGRAADPTMSRWDHGSDARFYEYYATASQGEETLRRFRSIRDCALRVICDGAGPARGLEVVDIGCGAGTQSLLWAEQGHRVHGLDVNQPLVELARERAAKAGYDIDFRVGTAVDVPWAGGSMDVCLVVELLEHVAEWRRCLHECSRVLRPGGVLVLTTTNKLCPSQQEFNLPLYSWYPALVKRHFERRALTTRPDLANYAKYPAINWFSFYGLRRVLAEWGFRSLDRFDVVDLSGKSRWQGLAAAAIRGSRVLRWLAHVATSGTVVVAVKTADDSRLR